MSPELVERLYTAAPDSFVASRDAAVAEARAAGDAATARAIGKLRKPTVAAWLVNLLAIRRADLVADLAELAAALREAQRELRGEQLRALSAQRRELVDALVREARALAREVDARAAGKLPLAEVESTLNAALSDTDVAEQVRSGRLVRAVHYAGFGEVPRPQLQLVPGIEPPPRPAPGGRGRQGAAERAEAARAHRAEEAARAAHRRALAKELAKARTEQKRAEADLERAGEAERERARALADIESALAELERQRAAAEEEVSRCKLARKAAERALVAARRRTGEVQAAIEATEAAVAEPAPG